MTPQWAKKVVWYQIFPERFRNGKTDNNPTLSSLDGAYPQDITSPWHIHPWTSDWYELQPYEKQNDKDIWYNIQRRRYGGDLLGIIEKLDYLEELGIGAIYLNPVFQAPSHHKYDSSTLHHIDPHFGPDPEGDKKLISLETPHDPDTWFWTSADKLALELIAQLHQRGMKVIFDGVFNHVGITHWAFRDVLKNQQDSVYRNWFSVKSWRDERNDIPFLYQGWSGYKELPEFKQDNRGIVAEPKKYIFDITKRWMDPNINGKTIDGIDGWRLDVAYCIKHPFWREWRCHVKQINPEAYITAEVIRPIDELKPYLSGEEFDAVMNYNFTFACSEYIHKKIQTQEFDRLLTDLRHAFHAEITNVQQNLLGSHDTERIGSHIKNGHIAAYRDWKNYHRLTIGKNPLYDSGKPEPKDIALQKLLAVFQMTYVGAPMIYYGDECGMWGANDPDCRKPMLWADLEYQDSAFLPDGGFKSKPDPVCVNGDLFNHYKNLIRIRNNSKALQLGEFKTIQLPTPNECYAFTRTYDNETVLVLLNKSDKTNTITAPDPNCLYFDLISKKKLETLVKDKKIEIPPRSGRILKMQQKP